MKHEIIIGDNLEVMRGMDAESVDLVATDPPFCTGRNFGAYDDRWRIPNLKDEAHLRATCPDAANFAEWVGECINHQFSNFLCFMGVRLIEMRRVLKPTGSIYLHCDQTANSYIRILMDVVFGSKNFHNEVVWCYGGGGIARKWWNKKHDTILYAVKNNKMSYFSSEGASREVVKEYQGRYNKTDEDGNKYAIIKGKDGKYTNVYLKPVVREDWWNMPYVRGNESTGYPTQKPVALYERIIKASCPEGGLVLDPFCGSGTTIEAAYNLNRSAVGIDINADTPAIERIEKLNGKLI